ncbi:hypothetical protein GGTG_08342 [Gaeumannomyces tritici R3-111a-1]|uniref:ATPase AAA-type core domain-containing protein n=1 Tax=Gaeumannomyces tritici (strain R3-111a-1) TaxID=644352 RepID=J3P4A6_GAET3|nr:hypothetical protein GGTG_08342 [Gaeumannomyces tritici R3-111a-1]EJT74502.1 hypothetical protein GGTG_08342 [Gaeumannomyces tritici R3-111a-1]
MAEASGDADSIASFEDITASSQDLVRSLSRTKPDSDDSVAPKILYVLQYLMDGKVVDTHKSDKPFDEIDNPNAAQHGKDKPIIEIMTKVKPQGSQSSYDAYRRHSYQDEQYEFDYPSKSRVTHMIIHSALLKGALCAVVGYWPGADFMAKRVVIQAPYAILLHHRAALARFRDAQPASHSPEQVAETSMHIDVLLGFLADTLDPKIREENLRHEKDQSCATFDCLWLLYRPGEVGYIKINGGWIPNIISRVRLGGDGQERHPDERKPWAIESWNLRYEDGRIQRNATTTYIRVYAGEQAISSLPIIPAALFPKALPGEMPQGESMDDKQVRLGKLYWDLVKRPTYKEYVGEVVDRSGPRGSISSRVVVDAEGIERFGDRGPRGLRYSDQAYMPPPSGSCPPPGVSRNQMRRPASPRRGTPQDLLPSFEPCCGCPGCAWESTSSVGKPGKFSGFEDLDPVSDAPPQSDLYYLALQKDVPAFILAERRWGHVRVEHLTDVKPDREAFKHLVVDKEVKQTVRTLISRFVNDGGVLSPWSRDPVKNKAEVRIFLLSGPPDVGETSTCEAAAEITQRPLLCLKNGDLGPLIADSISQNLDHFLQLGERYGALVLLEEADEYLESYQRGNISYNIRPIFLRAFEYYKGVLFLTANSLSGLGSAPTAALHYRSLTDAERVAIWEMSFDQLERDSGSRVHVSVAAREFASGSREILALYLNSRQIKNVLQVAVALAEGEAAEAGGGGERAAAAARVVVSDRHIRSARLLSR